MHEGSRRAIVAAGWVDDALDGSAAARGNAAELVYDVAPETATDAP